MVHSLPIIDSPTGPPPPVRPVRSLRAIAVHGLRIVLLAAIILLLHRKHQERLTNREATAMELPLATVVDLFPDAVSASPDSQGRTVAGNADGVPVGLLWQTSPQSDRIIGFSGPTNVLLAFGADERLKSIRILSSRDTDEHARQVAADRHFFPSYLGRTRQEILDRSDIDAVTGATLTSLAIAESIRHRLGGREQSLRFPDPIALADAQGLFPEAARVEQDKVRPSQWRAFDARGLPAGTIVRGSPAVDNIIGYQGPTDVLIAVAQFKQDERQFPPPAEPSSNSKVLGIQLGRSYDNEPYVGYVREDRYFFKTIQKLLDGTNGTIDDLAQIDLEAARVEGVSGATMTSLAAAQGVVATAKQRRVEESRLAAELEASSLQLTPRDGGTIAMALLGGCFGLSAWRGRSWLRWPWLVLLIVYLGFVNGDLLSQALLVGWAHNGVPWRKMLGPLVLAVVAFAIPVLVGRNVYCSHLCPHGALQQLVMNRLPRRIPVGRRLHRVLALIPPALLLWVVIVAAADWGFSLVDIEPFDAYVPEIAGGAAIAIFALGLAASLVVPMAYCQYGCPTGALLNWLRRHPRSDRLTWGDLAAVLGLAVACWL